MFSRNDSVQVPSKRSALKQTWSNLTNPIRFGHRTMHLKRQTGCSNCYNRLKLKTMCNAQRYPFISADAALGEAGFRSYLLYSC